MISRLIPCVVACSVIAIAPGVAQADDRPPCASEAEAVKAMKVRDASLSYPKNAKAKEHLDSGKRAFGVQEYDLAIQEYTAAGLADEAPLILYNLGQTYRAAKQYEKAIRQYRLFLDRGRPGDEVRELVECQIQTMTEELQHAAASAPPTGPAPETDEPDTIRDDPKEPDPDRPETPVEVRRSPWTGKRQLAVALAATGLVSLSVGAVFAIQVQDFNEEAARICPSDPCADADEANALIDRANSRSTYSTIALGAGVGLIAGAAVLWYVGAPSPSAPTRSAVVPQLSPTFAGIAYSTRF